MVTNVFGGIYHTVFSWFHIKPPPTVFKFREHKKDAGSEWEALSLVKYCVQLKTAAEAGVNSKCPVMANLPLTRFLLLRPLASYRHINTCKQKGWLTTYS
jgi:hypothetical protein